ncbi:LOW QUALITY PROTEIN: uncharacterized protein LOC134541400 [Bacillus rossius redtenbacheri]|uniref:LOW QUALITY PROTEIN: uncharacterized protein LOC134541400 n=1 Tax=Bacillus rossius redtenbacheri TaxID=93214 RepID=UPI002FDD2E87
MFDPSERKYEIESKLEKELDNLNLLRERTDRSSRLTRGMVGILSSFELRLARLEETILPVYNETENLQRRQENIENALAALDHVIGFYGVSQEVEPVIHAGPGGAGLDVFLAAMGRLQAAQEYFLRNIPQSVELENVTTLFNSGGDALNREFKELLSRHSKPVPPITLLDLVSADDGERARPAGAPCRKPTVFRGRGLLASVGTHHDLSHGHAGASKGAADPVVLQTRPGRRAPAPLQHFPDSVSDQLVRLAEWLMAHGRDEYMNVYARVRATVLLRSLQHLREHQKTASGGSAQGVPAASSPMVRQKFQSRHETPSRRASKRPATRVSIGYSSLLRAKVTSCYSLNVESVLEKRANRMLLKATQTLEQSTGLTLGPRRSALHLEGREDGVDEQETDNYLESVALQRLMQAERLLMVGIVPLQHQHQVFQIVVRDAVDSVVQDGESVTRLEDLRHNVPAEYADAISRALESRPQVFAAADQLRCTTMTEHSIPMVPHRPPFERVHGFGPREREAIQSQVDEMLRDGVIEPSTSPYNSRVVLATKKVGSLCFCVNFKAVNRLTIPAPPPPTQINITDALAGLGDAKIFTTLDLKSGYWQVPTVGGYQFCAMLFGLMDAAATFQSMMVRVLDGLARHGLTCAPNKCHIGAEEIVFLGHLVTAEGCRPRPAQLELIEEKQAPKTRKQLQKLMGLLNWLRSFVPDFATITAPMTDLLSPKAKFRWTPAADNALRQVKYRFRNCHTLSRLKPDQPIFVQTDASQEGMGAMLYQVDGDGVRRVIEYASAKFGPAERYHVNEQ